MGFFDRFKKSVPSVPEAVSAQEASGVICAPVAGRVVQMADVPDPVFSSGAMGKGCAAWPEGNVVYAPVSGTVGAVMGHAVGIAGSDGIEVLVHVGVDTVEMNGEGFSCYVSQGDRVRAGQPLLRFDRAAIAAAGHSDCVVLIVTNSSDYEEVALSAEPDAVVAAGKPVLSVRA